MAKMISKLTYRVIRCIWLRDISWSALLVLIFLFLWSFYWSWNLLTHTAISHPHPWSSLLTVILHATRWARCNNIHVCQSRPVILAHARVMANPSFNSAKLWHRAKLIGRGGVGVKVSNVHFFSEVRKLLTKKIVRHCHVRKEIGTVHDTLLDKYTTITHNS